MGLVCRHLEAEGIPTLSLTSARDITVAANPPRGAFVDFPLGHTSGRPDDPDGNRAIVKAALEVFTTATPPSCVVDLPFSWADDDSWKDSVKRPDPSGPGSAHTDTRRPRYDTPQYQHEADAEAAARSHAGCGLLVCAGVDY